MAEASTFYLEIITPERQFYIGPAEALVFPAVDGEMGVYPGHEPAVTAVERESCATRWTANGSPPP